MNRLLLILLFISQLVLAQNPEQVRLETMKPATASSTWGAGFEPDKAVGRE